MQWAMEEHALQVSLGPWFKKNPDAQAAHCEVVAAVQPPGVEQFDTGGQLAHTEAGPLLSRYVPNSQLVHWEFDAVVQPSALEQAATGEQAMQEPPLRNFPAEHVVQSVDAGPLHEVHDGSQGGAARAGAVESSRRKRQVRRTPAGVRMARRMNIGARIVQTNSVGSVARSV